MVHKVTLVETEAGDCAVFLNNTIVLSADPSAGDDTGIVRNVCVNLFEAMESHYQEFLWTPILTDWSWDHAVNELDL